MVFVELRNLFTPTIPLPIIPLSSESVLSASGDLVADLDLDLGASSPLGNADLGSGLALDLRQDVELGVQLLGLVLVSVCAQLVVVGRLVLPLLVRLDVQHLHEVANLDLREVLAQTALALLTDKETILNVHMGQPSLSVLDLVAVLGDAVDYFLGLHFLNSVSLSVVGKVFSTLELVLAVALQFLFLSEVVLHASDVLNVVHFGLILFLFFLVVTALFFLITVIVVITTVAFLAKDVCHLGLFREAGVHLVQEFLRFLIDPVVLVGPISELGILALVLDADVGLLKVSDPVGLTEGQEIADLVPSDEILFVIGHVEGSEVSILQVAEVHTFVG